MNKILIIDAYNMIHRCRFTWGGGQITEFDKDLIFYNFVKTLRSELERHSSDKVYFVLDGKPGNRLGISSDYKGNRRVETTDPEIIAYWAYFRDQKNKVINFVKRCLPITTVFHPFYEADDLIYHLVVENKMSDITIVSSDTDFIQILNEYPNRVSLYNPVSKKYRENTEYDYVSWKAMVGDRTDNIPGVHRVGDKTAKKILSKNGALEDRMADLNFKKQYLDSYRLIKLDNMIDVRDEVQYFCSDLDMNLIRSEFEHMDLKSISNDKYLEKFFDTFSKFS